jgi:hypothetical protein
LFASWARFVFRRRKGVLAASACSSSSRRLALVRGGPLTSGLIEGIESERALALVPRPPGARRLAVHGGLLVADLTYADRASPPR